MRTTALASLSVAFLCLAAPAHGAKDIEIVIYGSYGTPEQIFTYGRVLEKKGRRKPKGDDSFWRNLKRVTRDLESDEVPNVELQLRLVDVVVSTKTDSEGLFEVVLKPREGRAFDPEELSELRIEIVGSRKKYRAEMAKTTPVLLLPGATAIVSDIDDTVVRSEVTSPARLAHRILTRNAAQMEPIIGVAELYSKLSKSRERPIPFFYLSGSPINFFRRLSVFLELHGFPAGPMFLKNLGRTNADPLREQKEYKLKRLRVLAERLPGVRFILFGDSGEKDPEIYTTFRAEYPDRVRSIFIRRVETTPKAAPVPENVVRTEDALEAARNLVRMGCLSTADAEAVGRAVRGKKPVPEE